MVTRIPSSQGLVWRSAWEVPCEGPFSLAAKVACANELQFADVRDWVFAMNQSTAFLGNDTVRPVLCSSRVRYCRMCMDRGYHSWLFQLWQIDNCPIHDQPLHASCQACDAPTTLFPFDKRTKAAVDLRCPRCTEPYGKSKAGLSPAGWGTVDGIEKIVAACDELMWIYRAIPFTARLLNRDQWAPTASIAQGDEDEEFRRGKALFWVLHKLYGPGDGEHRPTVGLFHERVEGPPDSSSAQRPEPETGDLAARLDSGITIDDFSDATVRPSFGAPVPVSSKVPAWVHALSLWQRQHKGYPVNPSRAGISDIRYQADWLAASKIACEWREALLRLEAESAHPQRSAALLSTDERWYRRLGRWSDRAYSPVLHIADGEHKTSVVI